MRPARKFRLCSCPRFVSVAQPASPMGRAIADCTSSGSADSPAPPAHAFRSWHARCEHSPRRRGRRPERTNMHMRLLSATVSRDRYPEADQPAAHPEVAPVLRYFEAATFDEAMPLARAVYAGARHCVCCRRVLARQYDCLGSTLFRDDDPYELA